MVMTIWFRGPMLVMWSTRDSKNSRLTRGLRSPRCVKEETSSRRRLMMRSRERTYRRRTPRRGNQVSRRVRMVVVIWLCQMLTTTHHLKANWCKLNSIIKNQRIWVQREAAWIGNRSRLLMRMEKLDSSCSRFSQEEDLFMDRPK